MNAHALSSDYWRERMRLPAYRISDAAKYTRVSGNTVRSWHKLTNHLPVLGARNDGEALSYLQLIELAVVSAARKAGVSLNNIRRARDYCKTKLGSEFPFAQYRFKTDGKDLWLELAEISGNEQRGKLLKASKQGQLGWAEIIGKLKEFEYDKAAGIATRWYVAGRDSHILIDPRISFGAPSVEGIPTRLLKGRWECGEPVEMIADDFDIPAPHIIEALRFEGIQQVS